jgi:predicted acylesterase/phospholipase RssA
MVNFFRPVKTSRISHSTNHHNRENALQQVLHNNAGAFADGKKTWQLLFPVGIRKFSSTLYDIITGHKRAQDVLMSDTEHFRTCCKANIGNFTFQEAFDRTGRILNIIVSPQNRSDPPRLLNYLTAPHVLVWSAAVASSSLPGVFEPNKLLVKDADGTERSESATVASFIDGSMEQDLPMQQLSEMFNINHFIISQANPHAVLLASFGVNKSVWTNKLMGIVTGVLLFLKRQAKAWLENLVESIGGQRIAPMWDTRRGFLKQFFTQEYEGRDIDISLIPWKSHRSVLSAMLHCIYNPSDDEFFEWGEAAERETWKYIPKIKSHVAVEMTLDKCVQKLRLRLLAENRTSKLAPNEIEDMQQTMSNRLPSFFTSASLINMSGLGITDRHNLREEVAKRDVHNIEKLEDDDGDGLPIPKGWKGMGLRGNFSSGSLNRCVSGGSGLFMMDGEADEESATQQKAGESAIIGGTTRRSYLKTTSMSNFYYGRKSNCNLTDALENSESSAVEEFKCSSTV